MGERKESRKSEGLCEKIHNAVSPFRSRRQGKTIPVEFNHFSAQNTMKLTAISPAVRSAEKENSVANTVQELADRDILIVRGHRFAKSKFGETTPTEDKLSNHAWSAKDWSNRDDDWVHEGKFSDYITKVKNRMMKTASNVGSGGGGGGFFEKSLSTK